MYFAEIPFSHPHYIHHPKYIQTANEVDLQEHKRDIANRAQPSVLWIVLAS